MTSYTTAEEFESKYATVFRTFATGRTKSLAWRKWQLKQCWWLVEENEDRLVKALEADLHRHPFEAISMELRGVQGDILENLSKFEKWARGDVPDAGFLWGTLSKAKLRKEPLGVTFIMGAWNFPILLIISPLAAAIAAGNCCLLKPSELAPASQALLMELIPKYLDTEAIAIVSGGPKETKMMLEHKFNHIFYTGSNTVGRIVAGAAARYLTPTVLELGGQGPAIVCKSANIDLAAKRIASAKFLNSGQICLSVNHLFVDPEVYDEFIQRMMSWNDKFLAKGTDDFSRIINERNFDRITGYLKNTQGQVVYGGETDRSDKYIKPTIVKDVTLQDSLMAEEIFGPIAPIIKADVATAIATITSMPHPLGLYIFSGDKREIEHIINSTQSGGVTINDVFIHSAVPNAPFGGVGDSGWGSYHGKFGFDSFSHTRTVVSPPNWLEAIMGFRYAPYDMKKLTYLRVKNNLGFKKGETMEDQKIGRNYNVMGLAAKSLAVVVALGLIDSATGGRLLSWHTVQDVLARVRNTK